MGSVDAVKRQSGCSKALALDAVTRQSICDAVKRQSICARCSGAGCSKAPEHLRAYNHSAHDLRVLSLLALLVQEYKFSPEELLRHIRF